MHERKAEATQRSRSMKELYPCSGCEWATDPLKIFAMRMRRVDVSLYRAECFPPSLSPSFPRFPFVPSNSHFLSLSFPLLHPPLRSLFPSFLVSTVRHLSLSLLISFIIFFFSLSILNNEARWFSTRITSSNSYFRSNVFVPNCSLFAKRQIFASYIYRRLTLVDFSQSEWSKMVVMRSVLQRTEDISD